jgi:ElaB/YqjD/DUF883 family membrane-anchored ribosome-binding protein
MTKINKYIKYLSTLILLASINIYAQTSENLNQIISQAQQEASGLSPFFNLSPIINSPITKYLANTLGSSFLGFAIPFLFVFGVLTYITYEAKKEINRPLLLIYFIIDLLITIFFPAILILLAIILAIVLLFFGLYKLFHNITGSTIGGIAGAIITALIFFGILVRFINNSIVGFLALAFLILLSIFFLILTIYALLKIKNEPSTNNIKKLIYHIHKPEDVRNFENILNMHINNFRSKALSLNNILEDIKIKLADFESYLLMPNQSPRQLKNQIQNILKSLQQQQLPPQLRQILGQIPNLIQPSKQISQNQIIPLIGQLKGQLKKLKGQLTKQQQKLIKKLISQLQQLQQLKSQKQQLNKLKRDIRKLLNKYNKQYIKFNNYYNSIVNFINMAITNIQYNYNEPIRSKIIDFLKKKKEELYNIKRQIDNKRLIVLLTPDAKNLIKNYILK